ncbi:uncharacterized protein E0L32_003300 [Thyridium curvatum]|uniref:Uncharacterized protein n=1 Tax=Thyridium curvatum TaxID=1093900 RepID=A0A507B4J5_9PEZI|nr:uncharacterized protein E0L32_003300 [Thyridium curvatum]TPX17182.1 hypothetical protein E0L32_003300 [Thyridium curvatum]
MSRYAEVHTPEHRKGAGDARPTGLQIIQDEKREADLVGKVVIVTGTSSGIGVPTVEAMAATGATVYCTARDLDRAKTALGALLDWDKVHLLKMDLTSLASVKAFADEFKKRESKLNILINNAGVMALPTRQTTSDGFEMQIGTNHFAHFYLFCLLRDHLLAGATPEFNSRVVNLSSSGHRVSTVQLDDINLEKGYERWKAYGNSKTANIWMANQITRLYGSKGIQGYSVHPGGIETPLQKYTPEIMEFARGDDFTVKYMKSTAQGCSTTIFAAVARELEGKGGVFLEDCQIAPPVSEGTTFEGYGQLAFGHEKWAYDPEGEEKLWKLSLEKVGLSE